jgi:hypothetical protein
MTPRALLVALSVLLGAAAPVHAVDLAALLGNSGFEDDLDHSQWTATMPNADFLLDAPQVNPEIIPKGELDPLEAPIGSNLVGVLNPADEDIEGKLVHDPVAGSWAAGTLFEITVWANRGRLEGAGSTGDLTSEVLVQLYGWGAGAAPTIDPLTDNWSRTPSVKIVRKFTAWGLGGDWAAQLVQFTTKALAYVSFGMTGKNHKNASYVAFDTD